MQQNKKRILLISLISIFSLGLITSLTIIIIKNNKNSNNPRIKNNNERKIDDNNIIVKPNNKGKELMPYMDITLNPLHTLSEFYNNGAQKLMLAFMQQNATDISGKPQAWWAGNIDPSSVQAEGYLSKIENYESLGGKVGISFGGANGIPIWEAKQATSDNIKSTLLNVVDKYKLNYIDFDIEGNSVHQDHTPELTKLAIALKEIHKENSNLQISITLPVLRTGLVNDGLIAFNTIYDNAKFGLITNIMAMDYGSPNPEAGKGAISAAEGTLNSIKEVFKKNSISLEKGETYADYLGLTPMIGVNDDNSPTNPNIFTLDNAKEVANWAVENNLKWLGFWSATRDFPSEKPVVSPIDSGLSDIPDFGFLHLFKSIYFDGIIPKGPITESPVIKNYFTTQTINDIEWNNVNNVMWYQIYRDGKLISEYNFGTKYIDNNVNNESHTYKIVAIGLNNQKKESNELELKTSKDLLKSPCYKYIKGNIYPNANSFVVYKGKVYTNKWYVSADDPAPDEQGPIGSNPWVLAPDEQQKLPGFSDQAKKDLGINI